MLNVKIDNTQCHVIDKKGDKWILDGEETMLDLIQIGKDTYHIVYQNHSIVLELLQKDENGKLLTVKVNGIKRVLELETEMDLLLKKLGMDKLASPKLNQVKAPMPGLVLRILVKDGDDVKKGETLLVLEAMKMENVIKAPADLVVKKITVTEKTAVDKNQALIELG
jgi:biotin carboxyl carrier protein